MTKFRTNRTGYKGVLHSNSSSLVLSFGLISVLALIAYYLGYESPKWYKKEQDVTVHVFVQKSDFTEILTLKIGNNEVSLDPSVDSIQTFQIRSYPTTLIIALETSDSEIIRIDSLEFNGADDIHYHIRTLYKKRERLEADVDVFEFYPI